MKASSLTLLLLKSSVEAHQPDNLISMHILRPELYEPIHPG